MFLGAGQHPRLISCRSGTTADIPYGRLNYWVVSSWRISVISFS